MPIAYRYPYTPEGDLIDIGALPCPRCRSVSVSIFSHPAVGQLATCNDCGGRSRLSDFNDGIIDMERERKGTFQGVAPLHFERPSSDVILRQRPPAESAPGGDV